MKKGHNLGLGEQPAIDYPRSRISPILVKVEPGDVNKAELRRNVPFICKTFDKENIVKPTMNII